MVQRSTICCVLILITISGSFANEIDDVANRLAGSLSEAIFSLHTSDTHQSMDCFKPSEGKDDKSFGVFHTSTSHFSQLFYAESDDRRNWQRTTKLSDRGSQGTVKEIIIQGKKLGYFVAYELQNQHGNTIAIRYYPTQDLIRANNFFYEYQLARRIDRNNVQNVGTPSIQHITLMKQNQDHRYNQYSIEIKLHYSPDGEHDLPGKGILFAVPLRDFVDGQGHWVGGCKQNYAWDGNTDQTVLGVFRNIGCQGKIGQRDSFMIGNSKYYLYECNFSGSFDWKNWRIVLYSENPRAAKFLPLRIGGAEDFANPHITLLSKNGNSYEFQISVFLPSQGVTPGVEAKPGEVLVKSRFSYP